MNSGKALMAVVFLLLTGGAAGLILHASAHQQLGKPGVLTRPMPGTRNLEVVMPVQVPGYKAEIMTQQQIVIISLPNDTSFGACRYTAPDGFSTAANVVLMGTDRSSIHKPQVCMTGQGWTINDAASSVETIPMHRPYAYDLPVMRLKATKSISDGGETRSVAGVYVYWYVDGSQITADNARMMWWMARDILTSGVLDRFSYISYFSTCEPGQEDATFERMKRVIADTVPQYQLVPRGKETAIAGK